MAHGYLLLLLHVPKGQPCSMPRGSIHICVGQPCFMLGWWHPGPHRSEPCSMPGLWHPHPCESDLFRAGVTASQSPRVTALLRPLSQPEITSVPWLDLGIWAGAQDVLGRAAGAQGYREGPAGATECWWLQLGFGLIPSAAGEASSVPSIWGIPWPGREGEVPRGGQQVGGCTGLGDVLGKGDSTTVGVRVESPWSAAEGTMGCRSLARRGDG